VSPVKYELGFYILEDGILRSHTANTSNLKKKYLDLIGNRTSISESLTTNLFVVQTDLSLLNSQQWIAGYTTSNH
jgi:hypothetical protein